ncbi:MAG: DNRLRE domain-containing protein, partial [Chloroflexi bacterium]|nr:DNRLRE domain-containing protein [Chloroflexota bacterium]
AQDTYISSSNATTRYGLDATLKFGYRAGMGFHFAIIELPLRGIRAGATVTDATLTLTVITYPSSSFVAECERIVRYDWDQVTATYDEFRDGAPWTTDVRRPKRRCLLAIAGLMQ